MNSSITFLSAWNQYMYIGAAACITMGIFILIYHEYKILKIKDYKEKYDYVNNHEIRYFWYAVMAFILAAVCYANTVGSTIIQTEGMRWFYVRLFIIVSFMVIAYFIFFSLVRIYYPKQLSRRLSKLRNTPRRSPQGNPMRKLSELEEDPHLEASQIEEEQIQVVDYDVWIDEKTGFKKIEKYPMRQRTEECPECGYYTLRIDNEEIEKAPTSSEKGLLLEHYQCSYCGHREQREIQVAKLSSNIT